MTELAKKTPSTLREFMGKADDFVNTEDTLQALVDPRKENNKVEWRSGQVDKKHGLNRQERRKERRPNHNPRLIYNNLSVREENKDRKERHQVKTGGRYCKILKTQEVPRVWVDTRRSNSPDRRCQHRANGHQDNRERVPLKDDKNRVPIGEIRTIAGGFVRGGVSTSSRKAYTQRARYEEVYVTNRASKHQKLSNQMTISFGKEDREGVTYPHDDALVVTLVIANRMTRWALIDNRSSADILFWEAFVKMGINADKLRPSPTPLKGFFGDTI
ncbi:uncharacterized protein LOC122290966 [Carya illinoinensis]|uniref:uncharacterized protein LOC122290966 n=1 Tax=Carya illinoinensis TaxID=32201 RepID=UPI001C725EDA|nr:uncharacterized protein LOC122290966 [Carya illinoinensis]